METQSLTSGVYKGKQGRKRPGSPQGPDRLGYVGWMATNEFAERAGFNDPEEKVAWVRTGLRNGADPNEAEAVRRNTHIVYGVSAVTGDIPGRMQETQAVVGSVNVMITGTKRIRTWDKVFVRLIEPNLAAHADNCGVMGPKDNKNLSHEFLTGFVYPMNPTHIVKQIDALNAPVVVLDDVAPVFQLGTAMMPGEPGTLIGVLLDSPRVQPV